MTYLARKIVVELGTRAVSTADLAVLRVMDADPAGEKCLSVA
jgi:hypothetical protein